MIILNKIKINTFGSIKQSIELCLPTNGLISVQGENGSGKSSLLKVIAYCLDFLSEAATEFVNWDNQEEPNVELHLLKNNENLIIARGSGFFTLKYQNKLCEGSAEVKKKIKELLLDSYFISIMTNRSQGEGGNFSSLGPSDKQEFLSNLLNLNDFENLIDKQEKEFKKLELNLEQLILEENNLNQQGISKAEDIERNQAFIKELDIQLIKKTDELNTFKPQDLNQLDEKITEFIQLDSKSSSLGFGLIDDKIKEIDLELLSFNKQLNNLEIIKKDYNNKINIKKSDIIHLNNNIKLKDKYIKDIEQLKNNKCPTCEQEWIKGLELIKKHENSLLEISKNEEERKSIFNEIEKLEQDILSNDNEITNIKQDLLSKNKLLADQKVLKNKIIYESKEIKNQLNYYIKEKEILEKNNKLKLDNINNEISNINKNIINYNTIITNYINKLQKINDNTIEIDSKKTDIKNKLNTINELVVASKDFVRLITEDTLKLVSREVTDFLQYLPNANKFGIQFDTSKVNKNGKLKKEITLKVYKNGREINFKRLSGGERCSVHLAIDLAVSSVLAKRTGTNLNWFAFDEAMDGMSTINKKEALQMLKNIAKNKLILLIEHSGELSEYYDKVIKVENDINGSSFKYL